MKNAKRNKYIREWNKKFKEKYPFMHSYWGAKKRCNNPNNKDYHNYGGRGIKFNISFDEMKYIWDRDKAFLMKKPSIDRIDNDGNYELNNCRFIELNLNTAKSHKTRILKRCLKTGKFISNYNERVF